MNWKSDLNNQTSPALKALKKLVVHRSENTIFVLLLMLTVEMAETNLLVQCLSKSLSTLKRFCAENTH